MCQASFLPTEKRYNVIKRNLGNGEQAWSEK